jgi:hypothetical protein
MKPEPLCRIRGGLEERAEKSEQFALRIDRAPDPAGRALKALDGLSCTHLARLDRAKQGKEFIELHLCDPYITQEIRFCRKFAFWGVLASVSH